MTDKSKPRLLNERGGRSREGGLEIEKMVVSFNMWRYLLASSGKSRVGRTKGSVRLRVSLSESIKVREYSREALFLTIYLEEKPCLLR